MKSAFDILNKYKAKMLTSEYEELLAIMIDHFGEAVEESTERTSKIHSKLYNISTVLQPAYYAYGNEYAGKKTAGEKQIVIDKWEARGLNPAKMLQIRQAL